MNDKIITKRVVHCTIEESEIPCGIEEFISYIQDKTSSIPEEYKDTIEIEIYVVEEYQDSFTSVLEISYIRPETKEEILQRQQAYDQRKAWDLKELDRLKRKYEDE